MSTDKYQIDMCHGPLFEKIVRFSLPLILTYVLQLLFNAADLIVIGHYASHESMAAIGATMNLNSLVINIFIGLSVGSNVVAARAFGAGDKDGMHKAVHTTMTLAFCGGLVLMVVGLFVAKPLLVLMKTPAEILPKSCTYLWICFSAIPFITLYNYGCSILRAVGDTRRPSYFLVIAGILNVIMNLFFVICFKMDVAGVALATALSHALSATLVIIVLLRTKETYRVIIRQLKIDRATLKDILHIGIPAGLQSSCFAVSNMLIQSSINSFGALAMAGTTAAIGIEGIVYVGSYAYHQTAISFVAQNLGGNKYKRILKSLFGCFICAMICNIVLGWGFYLTANYVLRIFNPDPEVVRWGVIRMKVMFTTYCLCGIMDVASGGLRGLGYSVLSTIYSLTGACILRIVWVVWLFPSHRSMEFLVLSYPVSWAAVSIASTTTLVIVYRKLLREKCPRTVIWSKYRPGMIRGLRYLLGPK